MRSSEKKIWRPLESGRRRPYPPYVVGADTIFTPGARTADGSYLPTTIDGEGSALTISLADGQRLCGSIDVHDSSGSIRGTSIAPRVSGPYAES